MSLSYQFMSRDIRAGPNAQIRIWSIGLHALWLAFDLAGCML